MSTVRIVMLSAALLSVSCGQSRSSSGPVIITEAACESKKYVIDPPERVIVVPPLNVEVEIDFDIEVPIQIESQEPAPEPNCNESGRCKLKLKYGERAHVGRD
jgi:hypothetical protein